MYIPTCKRTYLSVYDIIVVVVIAITADAIDDDDEILLPFLMRKCIRRYKFRISNYIPFAKQQ